MTGGEADAGQRRLRVTLASKVTMRRIRWLWDMRVVLAGLTLLAGREGLGKSTLAVDLTAKITNGALEGEFHGTPRSVIYVNSEDARDYTIVPRLQAAGADLERVIFLDAITPLDGEDLESPLVLPLDCELLTDIINEYDAAFVVLDAATSVIDGRLDGDKDRQMRQGLERIARIAQDTGAAVLGLVHFGKRDGNDTGKLILGSIAWSQVARSVMALAADDEGQLVLTNTKANLAPGGMPSLSLVIEQASVDIDDDDDTPMAVGVVRWLGESEHSALDLLGGPDEAENKTERQAAGQWLEDYLGQQGHCRSADAKKEAFKAGFSDRTLQRARKALNVRVTSRGFPRQSYWCLPSCACGTTGTTGTTGVDQGKCDEPSGTTGGTTGGDGTTGGTTSKSAADQLKQADPDLSRASPASGATRVVTDDATQPIAYWKRSGSPVREIPDSAA